MSTSGVAQDSAIVFKLGRRAHVSSEPGRESFQVTLPVDLGARVRKGSIWSERHGETEGFCEIR